jgi:hypothetical protein
MVAETTSVRQRPDENDAWNTLARLGGIWLAGAAIALTFLWIGLARLAWLASRSTVIRRGRWHDLMQEIGRDDYVLRRPVRLLQSDHPTLLVTWGALYPLDQR